MYTHQAERHEIEMAAARSLAENDPTFAEEATSDDDSSDDEAAPPASKPSMSIKVRLFIIFRDITSRRRYSSVG